MKKNKATAIVLFPIVLVTVIILGCAGSPSTYSSNGTTYEYDPSSDTITITTQLEPEVATAEQPEPLKDYGIVVSSTPDNMQLGEICENDGIYVGLSYVKEMNYLPTELSKAEVSDPNNVVIIGFFDYFNGTNERQHIFSDKITCYADGIQVSDVENYIKVRVDGVKQFSGIDLEAETKMRTCEDFEVPKDWNELKFFYGSECVWTVQKDAVKKEDYNITSLYENVVINREETPVGTVINSGSYEVVFDGFTYYDYTILKTTTKVAVFKFTINNTSEEELKLYFRNCLAYGDDYLLCDEYDDLMEDKIDGYINADEIDSIQKGMSAKIYFAYEVPKEGMNVLMAYDDYIGDNNVPEGTVFVPANKQEE